MKHGRPYHLFRPSDLLKHRRRFFEEVTRDLDPSKREAAMAILESWREGESDKDLVEVLGEELAKKLLRKEKT